MPYGPYYLPTAGYTYDVNGRMSGMTWDTGNGDGPQPYANATYGPAGQILTLSYGAGTETRTYNSLLQLTSQVVPYRMNMTYNYSATQNNGRITGSVDGGTGENTAYSYDALNRLAGASNSLWSEAYGYGGFGNLTSKQGTGGSPTPAPSMNVSYDANNHQVGGSYDGNGNQLLAGGNTNSYTVENRLNIQYAVAWPYAQGLNAHDPWGKRVMRQTDPDPYSYSTGSSPSLAFNFYGITGQRLVTVTCVPTADLPLCFITGQNVYFGKKLLVSNGVNVVTDRLGSVRANLQGEWFAYYPYGEEQTSTVDGRDKFGTYFRDMVGQDYADQRYYGANTGAFFSPDPSMDNVDYSNPGTWNAYAYVNGDPVNTNDPSGLGPVTLPPVVPGTNCSTAFINYAGELGMTIQQLFDSDAGILGVMSYFEQEGSGSSADQQVWAALDWTFLNRWNLSASDKAWFYGPNNIPSSFAASVTTGSARSQVFTSSGQLTAGFTTDLLNILTGSPDSSQCEGLATAFDVAQGTINAENGNHIPGLLYITDPVPGALAFGSNGAVPSHSRYVVQTKIDTIVDSPNTWNFYSDVYKPPPPVRRPPPRRPRRPGQPQ